MNCEYIVHFVQSLDQMPLKGTFQVVAQQILACQGCPSAGHGERVRPLRSAKDVADEPGSLGVRQCVWNRRAIGGGGAPGGGAPRQKTTNHPRPENAPPPPKLVSEPRRDCARGLVRAP